MKKQRTKGFLQTCKPCLHLQSTFCKYKLSTLILLIFQFSRHPTQILDIERLSAGFLIRIKFVIVLKVQNICIDAYI